MPHFFGVSRDRIPLDDYFPCEWLPSYTWLHNRYEHLHLLVPVSGGSDGERDRGDRGTIGGRRNPMGGW